MIVTSEIIQDAPQIDGRREIRERHIDHLGLEHFREYLAAADADTAAILAEGAVSIAAQLRENELAQIEAAVLQGVAALASPPRYVTKDEAFRVLFEKFTRENDPMMLVNAAPFIDLFTNEEISGLLQIDAAGIAAIRQRANELKQAKAIFDSYQPPLGAE